MLFTLLQGGEPINYSTLLMFGMIAIVFYFFMIRPQTKKAKKAKKFKEALKKGDKIVTIGGIHGKVTEIKDSNVLIETEGGRLRIEKSAISVEMSTGAATNAEAELQQANR
jgi:preprotein translocase subunit YajC